MRAQAINNDGEVLSSAYVVHDPVDLHFHDVSLTRQEFAEECDINNIMDKYKTTGALSHINPAVPRYYDFSETPDLATALSLLKEAEEAFMRLPAKARAEFDNDAASFVQFAENPDNIGQMREWGLTAPEEPIAPPTRVEIVNPEPALDPKP